MAALGDIVSAHAGTCRNVLLYPRGWMVDRFSIIIPCYNEEQYIADTIKNLQVVLSREAIPYEIVVVNDNSSDRTAEVVGEICAQDSNVRRVDRQPPGGFGRAIRSGLQYISGDIVTVCMADGCDEPEDAVRLYHVVRDEGYDCAFGSRFIEGAVLRDYPPVKRVINRCANLFLRVLHVCPFNDLTNPFKAYRREVLDTCGPFQACHFNLEIEIPLEILIRKFRVKQITTNWYGDNARVSNFSIIKMVRRFAVTLVAISAKRIFLRDDLRAEKRAYDDQVAQAKATAKQQRAGV